MQPLATPADYELLIGPVAPADEPKLEYLLAVSSSVVVSVAPGLLPWTVDPADWPLDPDTGLPIDPGPVPEPAVLVTCQTAATMMLNPTGGGSAVAMERIGLVETQYVATSDVYGLLPAAWRQLLKPWRPPDMASVRLSVPHPTTYGLDGYGGDWWWSGNQPVWDDPPVRR